MTELLAYLEQALSFEVLGVTVWPYAAALAIIGFGFAFQGLAGWIGNRLIRRLRGRFGVEGGAGFGDAIEPAARALPPLVAAFIAARIVGIRDVPFVANVLETLATALVFFALLRLLDPLVNVAGTLKQKLGRSVRIWIRSGARVLLVLTAGAAILEVWGIAVAPFIAGLGVFGIAVALGAQDLFKNLIAGLQLLIENRFQTGDWIFVDGVVEGTVEQVAFRSTTVRKFDKSLVYVPNASLADNALTNFTRMTHRRIYWKIGIEYAATTEQLRLVRDTLETYVLEHPDFAKPPEVSTLVYIDSFNDSSVDMMLYCFTKTTNWKEWLDIKQELALAIKRIVEDEAKTGFAFPSQTNYLVDVARSGAALEAAATAPKKRARRARKPKTEAKSASAKSTAGSSVVRTPSQGGGSATTPSAGLDPELSGGSTANPSPDA